MRISDWSSDVCSSDLTDPDCSYRCAYYLQNSMNKAGKGYCDVDHTTGDVDVKLTNNLWRQSKWYNERKPCEDNGFIWYEVSHSDNLQLNYPVCAKTQFSRANHLGTARNDDILSASVYDGTPQDVHDRKSTRLNSSH